jgi:hypothetical protein
VIKLRSPYAIALASAVISAACAGGESATTTENAVLTFEQVKPEQWEQLSGERVFFGHQSVGGNLLDGIKDVMAANPHIRLNIVEAAEASQMSGPGLYHAPIGENGKPSTKLAAFREIAPALGSSATALMKYCYVDVNFDSDPVAMFEEYSRTVDGVRASNPDLRIVHVTLPLRSDAGTLRYVAAVARKLRTERELNLIRHRYNELLRQTYGGKEPIFDLARLEATQASGEMKLVRYQGNRVPVLANEWTNDGGHLNEAGRRRIAEAFLATLVSAQQPALTTRQ